MARVGMAARLAAAMVLAAIASGCKSGSADDDDTWVVQRVKNGTSGTIAVSTTEVSAGSYVDAVSTPFDYTVAGVQFTYDGKDLEIEILDSGEWRTLR